MRPKGVDSTYLQSLRYDEATKVLRVRFMDGAVIDYRGVLARTYKAIVSAESHGQKFSELVRDKYPYTIIKVAA
jgi:KTSC domain